MTHIDTHPKLGSIALSLAAGAAAILLVAHSPGQVGAVGMEVAGLVVGLVGIVAIRKQHRLTGGVLLVLAVVVATAAIGIGALQAASPTLRAELLPGMVGLLVLAGGAIDEQRGRGRYLVMAGAAFLFIGVLMSGVVHGASRLQLLAAGAATVVGWDTAEQGINLGEQVGTRATTWSAELAHAAGSVVVGAVAVGVAYGVYTIGFEGVSLTGLVLLLGGAITLIAALYN